MVSETKYRRQAWEQWGKQREEAKRELAAGMRRLREAAAHLVEAVRSCFVNKQSR